VRGFALARTIFDPTLPATASTGLSTFGSGSQAAIPTRRRQLEFSLRGAGHAHTGVLLDQMWLRFDIKHTVFVTAGRQHVRWGTARFWTPTDFLHIQHRNPLDVFDARTGTTMIKVHVPWEQGWNSTPTA